MGLETISGDELLHAAQGHIVTSSMLTSLADDYSIQVYYHTFLKRGGGGMYVNFK